MGDATEGTSTLRSIRVCVTGAEKLPRQIRETFIARHNNDGVVEGYGITECGPVVSAGIPGQPPVGVGIPMPNGTKLLIADIERLTADQVIQAIDQTIMDDESLEIKDRQGVILIQGPGV